MQSQIEGTTKLVWNGSNYGFYEVTVSSRKYRNLGPVYGIRRHKISLANLR